MDGHPELALVIVVDADPVIRMILEDILGELGYSSAGFDNATQALSYLVHIQGDCALIIADQGVPERMRGTELIRMVKERWPSIPSILASGYFVAEEMIPPSVVYLPKPYTLNQLETSIAAAVPSRFL
jgi:DNA-binding NtrC family response regulator